MYRMYWFGIYVGGGVVVGLSARSYTPIVVDMARASLLLGSGEWLV